jgi:DNA polymerase-3 subunit gamma/tau
MSYLVLARKYRPRNFTEMVGQEHVVQALTNALVQQRLHHAYLFTGTRGVGKTTVSRILAKSLNCQGLDGQGGITAEPCGVCQACKDIDSGRFVDYTELDAASNRGVDEIQSLLEQAVYKPVQGRFKVFMIDEVHMLTNTAFNAMLKTLEEPPEYLKFVLATTDPQKVPVTVLSRCLQFNLRPMAPETVFEHLTQVLGQENLPAEPMALKLLARAARGSMRDALSLTDQAIAFGSGQLQEATVRLMLGSVDQSHVLGLIDALARGDGAEVVRISETLRLNGLSAASALEDMSVALQRMAVLQAVPQAADASDDSDHLEMVRLSQAMPADETQLLYSLCLHGRAELGLAPDEYAALTMVLLRLLAFKPKPAHSTAGIAPTAEKKTLTTGQATKPEVLAEETRVATPVEVQTLAVRQASEPTERTGPRTLLATEEGDFWTHTVRALISADAITALVRELALQSQLIARDTDQWQLRIESESLNQGVARDRLQAALHAAGHAVRLVVEIGKVSDSPAQRNAVALAEKQKAAEELIHSDPLVQAMVQDFGAKIVPGSIKLIS